MTTVNYTNVILSGRDALVPKYDIEWLDNYIYEIYRSLGYKVIPMKSTQKTICRWGGIRCVSETYRRPVYSSKQNGPAMQFLKKIFRF